LAGKIASGKSTLSSSFAKEMGWHYASFGDYVRSVARQRGLDDSQRETLQQIGASLVAENCEGFCRAVLEQAKWQPGESLVIDGIRHLQVKEALEKMVAPSEFILTYISVDEQVRRQRLHNEGIADPARIERIESASTEEQVKAELPQIADFTLDGAEPLSKLVEELKAISAGLLLKNGDSRPTSDFVKRGQRVYAKLKDSLEKQHHGRYAAIEPASERYFLGDTGTEALVAAHSAMPDARFFLVRIGREAAHNMGGHAARNRLG
jgi:dephospho-CoA kinase